MSEQKEEAKAPAKAFKITAETRTAIMGIISTKPFNAVLGITKMIEKDVLQEEEANAIINALGQLPYQEVTGFFSNIQNFFIPVVEDEEPEMKLEKN